MKYGKIIFFFPLFNRGGLEEVAKILIKFFLKNNIYIELITFDKEKVGISHKKLKIYESKNKKKKSINFYKILNCSFILKDRLKKNNSQDTVILSLQSSVMAILYSKIYNFKIIIKNANPVKALFLSGNKLKNFFVFFAKIFIYNFADIIIVNSEYNKISLGNFIINKSKIIKIYNPLNLQKFKKKKNRKNYILYVGRVVKEKGLSTLIKAFSKITNKSYKLLIVGDGDYMNDLKLLINSEGLEKRVILTGWTKNPKKYFLKSKIFVLPTHFEAFGNVIVEAMHYNLISIVTKNSGGPDEVLLNGKYGFQFKKNDIYELNKKIEFCINNEKFIQNKINLAEKSLSRFSKTKSLKKYYSLLN
tara:strand:+ start:163 stop:1245 length:1083 start_codon:yes stop_codon:yes gene_type:complete